MGFKLLFFIGFASLVVQIVVAGWEAEFVKLQLAVYSEASKVDDDIDTINYDQGQSILALEAFYGDTARLYFGSVSDPDYTKLDACWKSNEAEIKKFKDNALQQLNAYREKYKNVYYESVVLSSLDKRVSFFKTWAQGQYNECIKSETATVCNDKIQKIVDEVSPKIAKEIQEFSDSENFEPAAKEITTLSESIRNGREDIVTKVIICAIGSS